MPSREPSPEPSPEARPGARPPRRSRAPRCVRGAQASKSEAAVPRTVRLVDGRRISLAQGAATDELIVAIASRQRARGSRRQLLQAGVDRRALDRRLAGGRLELVHRGVYALPHTAELSLAAETAALLACGEDAVLSHHSAITLWGLRPGVARPIHLTIPRDTAGPKLSGVVVHRSRTIAPVDVRVHHGLRVTSPARALLDAAAALPDRDVERLLDEAVFARRLTTLTEIHELLARAGRHPGRARLARLTRGRTRSTTTDSPPEERLFVLIRAAA